MKKIYLLISIILMVMFTGCTNNTSISNIEKNKIYAKMYKAKPKSILVLPAINTTTAVNATDYFRYTITQPLAEQGFYVFPVHLVDAFFKSENLSEAEIIRKIPLEKLKEVFDCDAVLYVDINNWDTNYGVLNSNVNVLMSYRLVDAKSGQELWRKFAGSSSQSTGNTDSLLAIVVSAVVAAINTGTDYGELALNANKAGFSNIPNGIYRKNYYLSDGNDILQLISRFTIIEGDRLYVHPMLGTNFPMNKGNIQIMKAGDGTKNYSIYNLSTLEDTNTFLFATTLDNQYYADVFNGINVLRNRYFFYDEANEPYLVINNKIVYVQTDSDNKIVLSKDENKFYCNITKIFDLNEISKSINIKKDTNTKEN